ncbi:MAG: integral rane efflux protein [Burkholderiales bacterium]|jgi:MFS family permease|nr:integral rane efflux protein [Burkholderiales bacterium]
MRLGRNGPGKLTTPNHNPGVRSHPFFFLASLAWNFGLGMTWLAVPLYAYAQGLSNAEIGILFAVPVLAQAPLNLVGGAYTDRIGGRRILLGSSVATIAAGLWFMVAHGFWMLLAGQIVFVLARAAFWPATWAMASELPGARGTQLGRLNAVTNFGQIVGTTLCGFMLAGAGFQPTFAVLALTGAVALVAGLWTQAQPPKPAPTRHILAAYLPLLRQRIIAYTIMCAYLSALPFSLSMSFYPVLLAQYGYGEGASGILLALRAVGSILASLLAGRFVRTGPQTLWPVGCGIAVAASVGFLPSVNHVVPIAFWLLVVGAGTAAMTLYFQITISEASKPEERGSALALGGLGWSVSHLTTPLIMGFLADRYGIVTGFYVLGALALTCAIAIAFLRHWAFKRL